jgi:protein SCO1/2
MGVGHAPALGVAFVVVLAWTLPAAAHTPDWTSRLLEWLSGKTASVGDAPSAGWLPPEPAASFRLVDQDGRNVTLRDFQGKVVLMNFMHARCADACSSMKELGLLANALGRRMGRDVAFVSITLDPERDLPDVLKALGEARRISPGWRLLTGPRAVIDQVASANGVYVKRFDAGRDGRARVEWSDVVLFIDRQGRLRKRALPHLLQLSGRPDVEWLLEDHDH